MPRRKLRGFSSALPGGSAAHTLDKPTVPHPAACRNRRRVNLDIRFISHDCRPCVMHSVILLDQQLAEEIACHSMNPRILTFAGAGDVENADLFSFKPRAYP